MPSGYWRTQDEGTPVDPTTQLFDNTKIVEPRCSCGNWLSKNYDDQFVTVATEKLLTYALGRGVEYRDMPLVRQIAHDVIANKGRFSSMVLGVVKSRPFQMNTMVEPRHLDGAGNYGDQGSQLNHVVHHEEAHSAADIPQGHRRHACPAAP